MAETQIHEDSCTAFLVPPRPAEALAAVQVTASNASTSRVSASPELDWHEFIQGTPPSTRTRDADEWRAEQQESHSISPQSLARFSPRVLNTALAEKGTIVEDSQAQGASTLHQKVPTPPPQPSPTRDCSPRSLSPPSQSLLARPKATLASHRAPGHASSTRIRSPPREVPSPKSHAASNVAESLDVPTHGARGDTFVEKAATLMPALALEVFRRSSASPAIDTTPTPPCLLPAHDIGPIAVPSVQAVCRLAPSASPARCPISTRRQRHTSWQAFEAGELEDTTRQDAGSGGDVAASPSLDKATAPSPHSATDTVVPTHPLSPPVIQDTTALSAPRTPFVSPRQLTRSSAASTSASPRRAPRVTPYVEILISPRRAKSFVAPKPAAQEALHPDDSVAGRRVTPQATASENTTPSPSPTPSIAPMSTESCHVRTLLSLSDEVDMEPELDFGTDEPDQGAESANVNLPGLLGSHNEREMEAEDEEVLVVTLRKPCGRKSKARARVVVSDDEDEVERVESPRPSVKKSRRAIQADETSDSENEVRLPTVSSS